MPTSDGPPSSPPNTNTSSKAAIAYYKTQYEQLESELVDFQASSRELEAELEKDIEASEKRERRLKEKVESLGYEVDEWKVCMRRLIRRFVTCSSNVMKTSLKTKYKQAKTEANSAQNTLQKEITTLRDGNRTLLLKLRDIEVANDDYERQARHTTVSLEDLDSKYNVSIERGVLLEEEIKMGEQEREDLRIENQHLRDELNDLKIETHIIKEKFRKAESQSEKKSVDLVSLAQNVSNSRLTNNVENSPATTTSSPTIATPPAKSTSSITSDAPTPPSPPFSESSIGTPKTIGTPVIPRPRAPALDSVSLPKASNLSQSSRQSRHSRNPSVTLSSNGRATPSFASRQRNPSTSGLPKSGSLYQIRGLIGKMQMLEQRVQSARSRLPAPVDTPPRGSPRANSAMGQSYTPSNITVRSGRKMSSGSLASSGGREAEIITTPSRVTNGRGSYGFPQTRTPSRSGGPLESRASSRTSLNSRYSVNHTSSHSVAQPRPDSRQSFSQSLAGSRTPLGHYSSSSMNEGRRPRSSLSNYNLSATMSHIDEGDAEITTPTPRQSVGKSEFPSRAIPTPSSLKKRQSGSTSIPTPRRISTTDRRNSDMPPPDWTQKATAELGETY